MHYEKDANGYEGLANRIIYYAFLDAKRAKRNYLKQLKEYDQKVADGEDEETLRTNLKRAKARYEREKYWFNTEWFLTLSRGLIDSNAIIEEIERG